MGPATPPHIYLDPPLYYIPSINAIKIGVALVVGNYQAVVVATFYCSPQ